MTRPQPAVGRQEVVVVAVLVVAAALMRLPCEARSAATGTARPTPAATHHDRTQNHPTAAQTPDPPISPPPAADPPALAEAKAPPPPAVCPDAAAAPVRLFVSPAHPWTGAPLRVIAVADVQAPVARLEAVRGDTVERLGPEEWTVWDAWGGPPWGWTREIDSPAPGTLRLRATDAEGRPLGCLEVNVAAERPTPPPAPQTGVWLVERAWDGAMEDLYSAWVARLFLVDRGARAGWRPLHQVFRDRRRNLLWGYLGLDEDDATAAAAVVAEPDCGDTPFFLRSYFAWKMRLPVAVRHCARGDARRGASCEPIPETNLTDEWDRIGDPVKRFNAFLEENIGDTVHSGTGRVLPSREGELYPVALSRETLRPGTTFVDIGGHVLVVSRWVPGTRDRLGMLLAVDAHPDRTVSHKRFNRANFFFDADLQTGGFKAFRPVRYENGEFRFATDDEIRADPQYPPPSTEQYEFKSDHAFYRRILALLNPEPLDPVTAYRAHLEGMIELLEDRVIAVDVGIAYMKEKDWARIEMPHGGAIFETRGPWEDYSTPARDLRLLIALDEVADFKKTVFDNPGLFRIAENTTPAELERLLRDEWLRRKDALSITYTRSDGTPWTLTLGEIVDRLRRFEQAYNPNDCPELRWGALRHTEEYAPCDHHAPAEQRNRMIAYRHWHAERRRPSGF